MRRSSYTMQRAAVSKKVINSKLVLQNVTSHVVRPPTPSVIFEEYVEPVEKRHLPPSPSHESLSWEELVARKPNPVINPDGYMTVVFSSELWPIIPRFARNKVTDTESVNEMANRYFVGFFDSWIAHKKTKN